MKVLCLKIHNNVVVLNQSVDAKMEIEKDLENLSMIDKFIIMLLYAAGGRTRGKLWLQKEIYVLSKAFKDLAGKLDFYPYDYGPFSEAVSEHLDMLKNSGIITKDGKGLSEYGLKLAKEAWEKEDEYKRGIVKETSDFMEKLDEDELLLYVYTVHGMAENSEVKKRILGNRVEIALRMLEKGKISLGLAAKLADLPVAKMMEEAIKRGIKPFDVEGDLE